jgi:type IV secretion system protein VirD4
MTKTLRPQLPINQPDPRLLLGWESSSAGKRVVGFGNGNPPCAAERPGARKSFYATDPEQHLITIAPTGAGKGVSCIIPTLLRYPGSCVVVDIKGEAAAVTARRREQMGHKVIVLDPFQASGLPCGKLNPFDAFPLLQTGIEDFALTVPECLHPGHTGSLADPFWDTRGDGLIAGVAAAIFTAFPPPERHLLKLRDLLMADDVVYGLAVLLDTKGKEIPLLAQQQIGAFLQTEDKCRSGIMATAQQHLISLYEPRVEAALCETSFDLAAFRDGQAVTIYLVIPPSQLAGYGKLLRILVHTLLSIALSRRTRPALPTLFIVDEAAQLGTLSGLRTAITLLRGYGVRTWTFWQDISQLKRLYPDWETIVNNAGILQVFGVTNHLAAKAAADLLGEQVAQADLLQMSRDEQVVLQSGGHLHRLRKLHYLRDEIFRGHFQPNPFYNPHQREAALR